MNVRQYITNIIRVGVRVVVGGLFVAVAAWGLPRLGIPFDPTEPLAGGYQTLVDAIVVAVDAALIGLASGAMLWLERRPGLVGRIFTRLFSLGINTTPALYADTKTPKAFVSTVDVDVADDDDHTDPDAGVSGVPV